MPTPHNDPEQPADAIAMLQADHQLVKDLFAQYEATSNAETKQTLAAQVFRELDTHAQLEETVFYPTVNEETDAGPALVKDSLEAHQTMKQLMRELRDMAHDTGEFETKFQVLISTVAHHIAAEEAEMFPLAEEELADDLTEMKDEMQELKADLQGS
jgi:hemerythrin-like domain-containing protein